MTQTAVPGEDLIGVRSIADGDSHELFHGYTAGAAIIHVGIETAAPVSLHGASGLPEEQVGRALAAGAVKLNVNTELRTRRFAVLSDEVPRQTATLDVLALNAALTAGAKQVAHRMLQLGGEGESSSMLPAEEEAMGQTSSID